MTKLFQLLIAGYCLSGVMSCEEYSLRTIEETPIMFNGSNTELELVENLVDAYKNQTGNDFNYNLEGAGSSVGIQKLIQGEVKVANASRLMNQEEYELAMANDINIVQAIIATDAVAIVTNPELRIDSLSLQDLQAVFAGEIKNWKELGGVDHKIHVYTRDENSGTQAFMVNKLLGGKSIKSYLQVKNQRDMLNKIRLDRYGIGYVGIGSIVDRNGKPDGSIWAMNIYLEGQPSCSPFELRAIQRGDYPLTRPLFQLFDGMPDGSLKSFLDFVLSENGQEVVRNSGYFPLNENQRSINRNHGF